VFVVADVIGKVACAAPPLFADYVVIEPGALPGHSPSWSPPRSPEDQLGHDLTLAHELGHACNLVHLFGDGTLMQADAAGRPKTSPDGRRRPSAGARTSVTSEAADPRTRNDP
jgi:hypothetical protein